MALAYTHLLCIKKTLLLCIPLLHLDLKHNLCQSAISTSLASHTTFFQPHGSQTHGSGFGMSGNASRLNNLRLLKEALQPLHFMDDVDSSTYASLLQGCLNNKALSEGKLVHAHIIQIGFVPNVLVQTNLVTMYAKCGSLKDGRHALQEMGEQNVVSWTAMIAAYSRHGSSDEALRLFHQMQQWGIQPNQFTFASILPACADLASLKHGKEMHRQIIASGIQSNIFVGCALLDMYIKCDSLEDAHRVFEKMPEQNVVTCNAMIAGYAQSGWVHEALKLFERMHEWNTVSWTVMIASFARHGYDDEALRLFCQMQRLRTQPDDMTFTSVLPACANLKSLHHGMVVHEHVIRSGYQFNVFVQSALLDMYVKCGSLEEARKVFDRMPTRTVVSWNAMIAGYARKGYVDKALNLFQKMPLRDVISWNAMITGYAQNGYLDTALEFFQKMPEQNVVSWTAMIAGYAQNERVAEAWELFQKIPEQHVVSWNAIIAGYSHSGQFHEARKLFQQMQLTVLKPNSVTYTTTLPACANLAALEHGKEIHKDIIRSGLQSDIVVENSLVDMYAKCGCLGDARKVFDNMLGRNVVSWSAMIMGYAIHGCGKEALQLFEQMQLSGTLPNHITFLGVLSACCHAGLVYDGWQYFNSMTQNYSIAPVMEHYCCMVDLLGRAGFLDEAQEFITRMPTRPDAAIWGSLLSACRLHTNVEIGEHAAHHLLKVDPKNAANYVLLSNIYAMAGMWENAEKVRKLMRDRKIEKIPGCSWIEIDNKVHSFHEQLASN